MLGDTAVAVHPDPRKALTAKIDALTEALAKAAAGDRAELEAELEALRVREREVLPKLEQLRDMAMAGHGIVLTPSFFAWQAVAMGELVPVLQALWPPPLNAYAVYPQTRYLSRRARAFIDFLAERFGENPYWDQ